MMTTRTEYEYHQIDGLHPDSIEFTKRLNEVGKAGLELVTMVQVKRKGHDLAYDCVFKQADASFIYSCKVIRDVPIGFPRFFETIDDIEMRSKRSLVAILKVDPDDDTTHFCVFVSKI